MTDPYLDLICQECKGFCCKHYPVFYEVEGEVKDRKSKIIFMNHIGALFYDRIDTTLECYWFSKGGCAEEIRPEVCKLFYCHKVFDWLFGDVFGPLDPGQKEGLLRMLKRGNRWRT